MGRTICKVVGPVLLVVGFLGFLMPTLLGMHLTPTHNVVHLLSGAIATYLAVYGSSGAVRGFCAVFGSVYLLLAILGFAAPDIVTAVIGHAPTSAGALLPDNLVHAALGGVFLISGLATSPTHVSVPPV